MPEMDGFELTRRVREKERQTGGRRLPIVAITANAFEGETERFRAAGMDDYLCKPVQLSRLQATIERWLAGVPEAGAPVPPPAPPQSAADIPIDVSAIAALCGDDAALINEMFHDFITISRQLCAELADAVGRRLPAAVRHSAHSIKGSSRTAGARPLGDAARALEVAAETAPWPEVVRLAGAVQSELDRVARHLESLQPPSGSPNP